MARRRDHRSVYERRKELARQAGYDSLRQYDRAKRIARTEGRSSLPPRAEVERRVQDARDRAAAGRRQVHDLGSRRIVTTTSRGKGQGVILGQLAAHGSGPARLSVKLADGRTVQVFGRGASARAVADIIAGGADDIAEQISKTNYGSGDLSGSAIVGFQVELLEDWPT